MTARRTAQADRLTAAAVALLAANLLHGLDHLRPGLAAAVLHG